MCGGVAVSAGDLGGDPFGRRRIAIENRDLRALVGKGTAGGGANPVPAAGDEGDFSGKIFHHLFNSVIAARRTALSREIGIGLAVMRGSHQQRSTR
jgi:hypothetical protein